MKGLWSTAIGRATGLVIALALVFAVIASGANVSAADPYVVSANRSAYASSAENSAVGAEKATDGDTTTRWSSEWAGNSQWIYVDLGKVTEITSVKIYWEGAYATRYAVQFSNDEQNWSTQHTVTNGTGGVVTLPVSGNARFVRLLCEAKAIAAYGYSIYEFEVYGQNGLTPRPIDYGTNLSLGKAVTSSSLLNEWWMYGDQSTVQNGNINDGNNNTRWCSSAQNNQWVYVDLGGNYQIGHVVINWDDAAGRVYDIQVSNDANNWSTIYREFSGCVEKKDVQLYANARYVRIYGHARYTTSGLGIRELEIYQYINGDARPTYQIQALPVIGGVAVGAGSYAINDIYMAQAKQPTYLEDSIQSPVASNDWWQSMVINKLGNALCLLPLKVKYETKGLGVLTLGEGWMVNPTDIAVTTEGTMDLHIVPENMDSSSFYNTVSDYGDYSVTAKLYDANGLGMTSTFVKGSPYFYNEFGSRTEARISGANITNIYTENNGNILTGDTSYTGDHIGIEVTDSDNKAGTATSKSYYSISVPAGTVFKRVGTSIKVTFPGANGYMSVGTMTSRSELAYFYQHGYAFPTNTRVTYTYDETSSNVTTNFTVETKLMRSGFSNQTLQCLMPHQWKQSSNGLRPNVYPSVRGDLKLFEGNTFTTVDKFLGILPNFASPTNGEYDNEALISYLGSLDGATAGNLIGADAYWQGKSLHPLAMGVLIADQIGNTHYKELFLSRIKTILTDWYTFSGEGDVAYLFYDQNWGTLYYGASEFGANTGITDHHFTYGYMVFSAVVLATYDDEFYNNYKDMIELMIRDYASPYEDDPLFCRFRNYDMYEGHSWAGGYADNDSGNNQEAAGESLFGWVAEYLWGVRSGNKDLRDAGIFGFTTEMNAIKQYWFNYDNDNWLDEWPYEICGQIYGSTYFYGTFFGGQPLYVSGIHWIPVSEWLTYYGMEQQQAAEMYDGLWADTLLYRDRYYQELLAKQAAGTLGDLNIDDEMAKYPTPDNGWQHITWTFLSQTNPQEALQLFNNNSDKVQTTDRAITYWFVNNMIDLGVRTDEIWATGGVSATVYVKNGTYSATVWNPTDSAINVTFRRASGVCGSATVAAKSLVRLNPLAMNQVQVNTPVFSVNTGTYTDTQYVSITSATPGASIYYTVDGSIPTTSSTLYTGKIVVSSTATIKAIAVKNGSIASKMADSVITVNGTKEYNDTNIAIGKNVVTSSSENAGVSGSSVVDGDATTRWASSFTDNEWIYIDLGSNRNVCRVSLTWEASYATRYQIQVSQDANNWVTVYTDDNGNGGTDDIVFASSSARYVRMLGVKRFMNYGYSLYEFAVYESAQASAPQFSLAGGSYSGNQTITISTATKGAEIRYTLDGSTPNANSLLYIPGLVINNSCVLKAVAIRKGMVTSSVTTATYTINGGTIVIPEQPEQPEDPITNYVSVSNGTKIEAEAYVDMYGIQTEACGEGTDDVGYTDNGDWLDYQINVTAAGTYYLDLRVASPNGDGLLYVNIDNNKVAEVAVGATGGWQIYTTAQTGSFNLTAGNHTLRIFVQSAGININYFTFVTSGGTTNPENPSNPENPGTTVQYKYEAEDYANMNGIDTEACSEGTNNVGWIDATDWMDYDVNVAAGNYKLVLRYAGTGQAGVAFQKNGTNLTTVTLPATGGWQTWTNAESGTFALAGGAQTLRIYFTAGGCNLNYFELVAVGGTTNPETPTNPGTTQGKLTIASASSSTVMGTNVAGNAIDNDTNSRWESEFVDNANITFDLGSTKSVNKVVLNWEGAYGKAYYIQVSIDGSNYQTVYTQNNGNGGIETITFNAVDARYVRLQGGTRGTIWGYSLWEAEIHGATTTSGGSGSTTPSNPTTSQGKLAIASATSTAIEDGLVAANAIDNNTGTRWGSAHTDNQSLTLDLGSVKSVSKVVLNWEGAYGEVYYIQVSTDGVNYQTVYTENNGDGGIDTLTFDATNARYVRMQGGTRGTRYGYSLWEMEVHGI